MGLRTVAHFRHRYFSGQRDAAPASRRPCKRKVNDERIKARRGVIAHSAHHFSDASRRFHNVELFLRTRLRFATYYVTMDEFHFTHVKYIHNIPQGISSLACMVIFPRHDFTQHFTTAASADYFLLLSFIPACEINIRFRHAYLYKSIQGGHVTIQLQSSIIIFFWPH